MNNLWRIVGCWVVGVAICLAIYSFIKRLLIWTPKCGMNKIQLIILWCMGIILSIIAYKGGFISGSYIEPNPFLRKYGSELIFYTKFNSAIGIGIPILIIGSLLIYTFRKK